MKNRKALKLVAILISMALMIPMAGCRRNSASEKQGGTQVAARDRKEVVAESDPYFYITEKELSIPVEKDRKVVYADLGECRFVGDQVFVSYMLFYETEGEPEGVSGRVLFDKDGKLLMDLSSKADSKERIEKIIEDNSHELYAVSFDSSESSYSIQKLNQDGSLGEKRNLPAEIDEDSEVLFLPDGNLMIANMGELSIVASDGTLAGSSSQEEFMGWVFIQDGKYYGGCNHYSPEDWDESYTYIRQIDPKTGELKGEKMRCGDLSHISRGMDRSYLITEGEITKVDLLDLSKNQVVFSWNDTDYDSARILDTKASSDQEFYFIEESGNAESEETDDPRVELKLLRAVRAEKNPNAGKKIILIGAFEQDVNIRRHVIRYNLDPDSSCRVELYYYSLNDVTASSGLDMEKRVAETMSLDLLSGNGPDILMNASWLSRFNSDEVLVDLNTLIDSTDGTGLDRNEYLDSVFRASEQDGKLYHLPLTFYVRGWAANRELLGDASSYTYKEFLDACEKLPEDVSVFTESPYNDLLSLLPVSEFVDYEKGQVHFEDAEFQQLLELVRKYGSPRTHEQLAKEMEDERNVRPDSGVLFRENMLAFTLESFEDLFSYARAKERLGGKGVFCGIPSRFGGSMMARVNLSMAISASSRNQKEAWEFLRFMVSDEQQEMMTESLNCNFIPVSRKALDLQNEKWMEFNREQIENYVPDPRYPDEKPLEITDETLSEYMKILESIRLVSSSDPELMSIVMEEAAGYFTDQRSLDEVCRTISNRAKTIVQERG
ncbi:MAG: extracellular solute-binding protein [Clostridiales bacterium]|nr:extracellular solute-binding protein [Clostridiales bacterium]